jgi:hypothetical protein
VRPTTTDASATTLNVCAVLVQVGLALMGGAVGAGVPVDESPPQPAISRAVQRKALAGARCKKRVIVTAEDARREGRKIAAARLWSMPRLA